MPYSILVRRLDRDGNPTPAPLAIDVGSRTAAQEIARRLACSYPCHGQHEAAAVFWFRDREGCVEIWPSKQ